MDLKFSARIDCAGSKPNRHDIMDDWRIAAGAGRQNRVGTARTAHLDALAAQSALGCGATRTGVTVESGPGHLGIFGYDPIEPQDWARRVGKPSGVEFDLGPNDVAARGIFCSVDAAGVSRIAAPDVSRPEASRKLSQLLTMQIDDVEFFVETCQGTSARHCHARPGSGRRIDRSDPHKRQAFTDGARARLGFRKKRRGW